MVETFNHVTRYIQIISVKKKKNEGDLKARDERRTCSLVRNVSIENFMYNNIYVNDWKVLFLLLTF